MNRQEYLLTCLAEECAEVQKEVTKCLRFGIDDNWKDRGEQRDRVLHELNDVLAIVSMLQEEGILPCWVESLEIQAAKKQRVEQYMLYAESRGTLVSR